MQKVADKGIVVGSVTDIICNVDTKYFIRVFNSDIDSETKNSIMRCFLIKFALLKYYDKITFIMCILSLIRFLWTNVADTSVILILERLLESLKAGQISKKTLYAIFRKLRKDKIPFPIDPIELIE